MMKRLLCLLAMLTGTGMSVDSAAQAADQYAYRIAFTDKAGAPAAQLSPRAIARRSAQGIALDALDQPVSPDYLDSVLRLTGGKLHVTSRWFNQVVILLEDSSKMQLIRNKPFVAATAWVALFAGGIHRPAQNENNLGGKGDIHVGPIAATAEKPAGFPAFYAATWPQTRLVNGDYLHDRGYMGQGKLIAVLDEGFSGTDDHFVFDSLRSSGRIVDVHNFLRASNDVYGYGVHGTACLSTMAGYAPSVYIGSAPFAFYALYITEWSQEQPVEMDQLVAGLERADSLGADVVSSSLGYNFFTGPVYSAFTQANLDGNTTLVARGVNAAAAKGMLVVVSAGNEGGNSWNYLLTPADASGAMTVGAVNTAGEPWAFSSPGPNASGRVKPDVCLQGAPAAVCGTGSNIYNSSGTSYAAPQLAGYAACLWGANPSAVPEAIREAIRRSAHLYSSPTPKMGYGIPDFSRALAALDVAATANDRPQPLQLWPNPLRQGALHLRLPGLQTGAALQVSVSDARGRRLAAAELRAMAGRADWQLPLSLAPGIYFVRAVSGGQVFTGRLLQQ